MVRKLTPTRIRQKVSVEEVLRARNQVEQDCETKRYVLLRSGRFANRGRMLFSIDFSAISYWVAEPASDQRPTSAIR